MVWCGMKSYGIYSTVHIMNGRVVLDIQNLAEGKNLYILYNTTIVQNVVNGL
jgi:hypothetical protein